MNFIPLGESELPGRNDFKNCINQSNASKNHSELKKVPTNKATNQNKRKRAYTEASAHSLSKKRKTFTGPAAIRLHEEIKLFYEQMRPTAEDIKKRQDVVAKVTEAVKSLWSGARVELFGSFVTGLYLPTSDIDMVIFGKWPQRPLRTLKEELVRRKICNECDTQVLDKATVPILKIKEASTNIKVDISFNMTNGLITARLIKGFVEEYPSLKYLVMILKQFLLRRDLNEVYTGGLSSYSVILLVVSFLQLHARGEGRSENVNLGVQLLEFLELYGVNFNYSRSGISVRNGGKYVRKPEMSGSNAQSVSLYIEDPVILENDVCKGSYNMHSVQLAFSYAYHSLSRRLTEEISGQQPTDNWGNPQNPEVKKRKEGEKHYESLLDIIIPPNANHLNRTF